MSKGLSSLRLEEEILKQDKRSCRRFGNSGVGEQAIYLGGRLVDRYYYIPISRISRIYKLIAMSKGGFTGKGIFGTIPYLVVEYDGEKKSRTTFKLEDDVDRMLACMAEKHPEIPTKSRAAEERLAKAEAERRARVKPDLPERVLADIRFLTEAKEYLEQTPMLCQQLSSASKAKRMIQATRPGYRYTAMAIVIAGIIAALYGGWSLISGTGDFGLYFLLFGFSAILMFSGANVMPTAARNRRAVETVLGDSLSRMETHLRGYESASFPLPARYAHPICLDRMIRSLEEGRAESVGQAYELLKADLRALNSDVQVSQEEYDEVVAIKPMFLLHDYA